MAVLDSFSVNESNPLVRDKLISEEVLRIYRWIIYAVAILTISLCGTVANIINIVCFAKQGFKDSVNVNFVGLAVSDLGCLGTLILMSIGHNPDFLALDVPFDHYGVITLFAALPHIGFLRVTCLITALITVERCLCITIPLKVKYVITPKRTAVVIGCIYVVIVGVISPMYYTRRLAWAFSPDKNRTVLKIIFTHDHERVGNISFAFSNAIIPFSAFVFITMCTGILVVQLKKKSKWRSESISVHQAHGMSNRDRKISRMVVAISILFITCYFPSTMLIIVKLFSSELSLVGQDFNVSIIILGFSYLLEAVNATFNIVIYYRMSRKYRENFRQIFRMSK